MASIIVGTEVVEIGHTYTMSGGPASEDEFDEIPFAFEGIDFDSVPELTQPLVFRPNRVGDEQAEPLQVRDRVLEVNDTTHVVESSPSDTPQDVSQDGATTPSYSDYSLDPIDDTFLEELDSLERAMAGQSRHVNHVAHSGSLLPVLFLSLGF